MYDFFVYHFESEVAFVYHTDSEFVLCILQAIRLLPNAHTLFIQLKLFIIG